MGCGQMHIMGRKAPVLAMGVMLMVHWAGAQPFTFSSAPFVPELGEPAQRTQDAYVGFTYNFNTGKVGRAWEHA